MAEPKLSSRNATFVLSEVASSLGHDVITLNINKNSNHHPTASQRATTVNNLKSQFFPSVPLMEVHGGVDFQRTCGSPSCTGLVRGEQLLGVEKICSGTGEPQADAVVHCWEECDVVDRVVALCFDTTNTCYRSEACVLVEQKIGRDLLFLAYRHLGTDRWRCF